MKKLTAVFFGLAIFGLAGSARAQFGLEAHGLYTFEYSHDDLDTIEEFGGGGGLTWKIIKWFRLDLAADYYRPRTRCPVSEDQGKIRFVPVTIGAAVGGPVTDCLFLYLGGGTGWSFNSASGDEMEAKDCLVWYTAATLEYLFTGNLSLQLQYRYTFIEPDIKNKPMDMLSKDVSFDHMEARIGLAFYF